MQSAAHTMHRKRTELFGPPESYTRARTRTQETYLRPPRATHTSAGARAAEANRIHHQPSASLYRLDRSALPQPQQVTRHASSESSNNPSTEFIDNLAWTIHHKKWELVTIKDFESTGTSDGKSLLVTMVVNQALSRDPGLSATQLARLTAHAALRHPGYLLNVLTEIEEATGFIAMALETRPPQLDEKTLCPMDTPYLIEDATLRDQLGSIYSSSPSELRRIFTPFLQCFYPGNWEILEQAVRRIEESQLTHMIAIPGALHAYFLQHHVVCPFSPPRWIDLSHLRLGDEHEDWEDGSMVEENSEDKDEDPSEYICPITEMGFTLDTFSQLTPEQQHRTTLAKLPSSLTDLLPPHLLRWIMKELREMATPSIVGALEPSMFRRLLELAPKEEVPPTPTLGPCSALSFSYRFRLQNVGKGAPAWTNTTPGSILTHWLNGWIPMFIKSEFSFTLTRHPSDNTQDPLTIQASTDIPSAAILEHYTFDTQIKKGKLIQFDIWFTSDCEDINNNGAQSFLRNSELQSNYSKEVRGNFIYSMKMERRPIGLVPCIMLERSLLRDNDDRIKQELINRAQKQLLDIPDFAIEWITIGTSGTPAQTMIKCVLAAPTDHQLISKLWTVLQSGANEIYPTTSDYRPLVIPYPRTPAFDQEINQAIARHLTYVKSLTHTILLGLQTIDLFTYIPKVTLLAGFPDGQNNHTIAHLLRHGVLDTTGSRLASPVKRITTDAKGSRIYLHGARTDATNLLTFTREIIHLLPAWLEDAQLEINLDTSDADRAAHTTPQTMASSNTVKQAPLQVPTGPQISTPPPLHPELVQIPIGQWNHAMHTIAQLTQRLATVEERVSGMTTILENTPTITTLRDTMDDVISTLTQTITSHSESIKEHAAHTSSDALTTVTRTMDANNGHILKLCDVVNNNIASSATTITDALTKVSDMASTFTNSDTSPLRPRHSQHAVTTLSTTVDDFTTGIAPILNLETNVYPTPSDAPLDSDPGHNKLGDASVAETRIPQQSDNLPLGYESPEEDLTRPRTADCFGCNKIDDNIQQCDHCELPFHQKCLIASPPGGTSHYCPECSDRLLPAEPPSSPSHHSPPAEDHGLTESSGLSTSDSEASEYAPNYKAAPMSNSTQLKSQTRELRPRKKR